MANTTFTGQVRPEGRFQLVLPGHLVGRLPQLLLHGARHVQLQHGRPEAQLRGHDLAHDGLRRRLGRPGALSRRGRCLFYTSDAAAD